MANEGRVSASLSFSKDEAKTNLSYNKTFDITGDAFVNAVQEIGNTEEEVAQVSELGNAGYVLCKNLHSTNDIYMGFADVSTADDARPIILKPGDIALFRLNYAEQAALYARTSAGTANLQYLILEY